MRKLILLPLLTIAALGFGAATAPAAGTTVSLKDDYFSPKSASMTKNSTATFRFAGRKAHNVIVRSGPARFNSPTRTSGTYRKKLTRAGTYKLYCSLHSGMTMTLRVR